MIIVCSTDDNFVQHCCIMLTSVLINNSNVSVYVLTEKLTEDNLDIIKNEIESKGGVFHLIVVDSSIISKLPMPDLNELSHISSATYYRLLISYLLPTTIDRIIYLDCDIIVRKSLEELWETKIEDYALGAVYQLDKNTIEEIKRLGYPLEYGYFNAGVLLINMDYWRKNKVSDRLLDYLIDNYNIIKYHDQDALNSVLHKECLIIPSKWNMQSMFFFNDINCIHDVNEGKIIKKYKEYKKQIKSEKKDPTIIHYVSKPKPWNLYCVHPFRKEYYKYAMLTNNYNNIRQSKLPYSSLLLYLYYISIFYIYKNHIKVWLKYFN